MIQGYKEMYARFTGRAAAADNGLTADIDLHAITSYVLTADTLVINYNGGGAIKTITIQTDGDSAAEKLLNVQKIRDYVMAKIKALQNGLKYKGSFVNTPTDTGYIFSSTDVLANTTIIKTSANAAAAYKAVTFS